MNDISNFSAWDERYASDEYIYGKEPNRFFAEKLETLNPGQILLPGEGEGRNAAWAAARGWRAMCFDQSTEGRKKALQLASERGLLLDYRISTYQAFYTDEKFEAAGLFFTHTDSLTRRTFHEKLISMLKPGAYLIMEGFSREQLNYQSGGPKDPELLWDTEMLKNDFINFEFLQLEQIITELNEGEWHRGTASLVRMFARKKEDI